MSSFDQTLRRDTLRPAVGTGCGTTTATDTPASISTAVLVSLSIVSAILVPSRMLLSRGATDDSSVFAYIGWAMKHGLMPYRDVWDHKGPLLQYLQFAGESVWPNSTVGIGLLELVATSATFFLCYRIITSFSTRLVGISMGALCIVFVTQFSAGGNMCESWALLPLAVAQYASWRWAQRTAEPWWAAVLGVSFASIFWIRANMVVFPIVAMAIMLFESKRKEGFRTALQQLVSFTMAALVVTSLVLAPLYHWGIFHEFVAAYFGYNGAYSRALSLDMRILHTRELLTQLFAAAIGILGVAGWGLGLRELWPGATSPATALSRYLRILLFSLPIEIGAAILSGRNYGHYLLPLFPTLALLAAWFLSEFERQLTAMQRNSALLIAFLVGLTPLCLAVYSNGVSSSTQSPKPEYVAVARFIRGTTSSNDRIIVLGGTEAAYINLLAQRLPASRFVYQFALIDPANPSAGDQRQQFMCELASNRPAVIVSVTPLLRILCSSPLNCAPQPDPPPLDYGYQPALLPKLMNTFVESQYRAVTDSRFGNVEVLVRKDLSAPARW